MDQQDFRSFSDLDSAAVLSYQRATVSRRGRTGRYIAPTTVELSIRVLQYLYRYRDEVGDGLTVDPCGGQSAHAAAGVRQARCGAIPYTPDVVAVPLVQGAIAFLAESAVDILCARERYAAAYMQARHRGYRRDKCRRAGLAALRSGTIRVPAGVRAPDSLVDLGDLVDRLYTACFVVISYLVGPRVSEVLSLQAGCVKPLSREDGGTDADLAVISGSIFKLEADYYGRRHNWVAPPPAVHAVFVLEALSAPHRQRTGRTDLWLRPASRHLGASEWQPDTSVSVWIPRAEWVNQGLRRLSKWFALPSHEGRPWKLSTHQGRKTFARFAALRDRTSLFALAQHLGHRDRAITDRGYVGTDYSLAREIGANILDQSVSAWEHMLSQPRLGGRAGQEILATRPRFHGAHMKQDIRSYARLLADAGLTLGLCDWGFCVYRQPYSACLGTAHGPNPVRREPSTCSRCRNFAVSAEHRPYWEDQARRYEALLNEPALPTQSLKIARERLVEALAVLQSIDVDGKERHHDAKASR